MNQRPFFQSHPAALPWHRGLVGGLGWTWLLAWSAALAAPGGETALAASGAHASAFSWLGFLGPFHMVVLHYPIGFLTLAVLLEAWRVWQPNAIPLRISRAVLVLSAASAVVAAGLGWCRAQAAEYDPGLLGEHLRLGFATAGLAVLAWALHDTAMARPDSVGWRRGYRAILLLAFGCLLSAGHHGGSLTHGRSFLSENAPTFLQPLLGPEVEPASTASSTGVLLPPTALPSPAGGTVVASGATPATAPSGSTNTPDSIVSTNLPSAASPAGLERYRQVQAIFMAKCYSCHGPEKQKNKYRLDDGTVAVKGGKSGVAAIVPGDPFQSNLVRLIFLPRNHDEAMPPEGKEGLTPEETWAVVQWIQAGAPWP